MKLQLYKLQLIYHHYSPKTLLIKIFISATIMAILPCLDLFSSPFQRSRNLPLNTTDLNSSIQDLLTLHHLNHHHKTLTIGKNSIKAVTLLRSLGFHEAIGVDRSMYALPFREDSFDFVFSMAMIDGVRVPAKMVLEMERVLKPGRVGVVLRRFHGLVPKRDVMKAAGPVGLYLRTSDVVGVRVVHRTVMVVFRKKRKRFGRVVMPNNTSFSV